MKIWWHLGDGNPDYRGIMREQGDFCVGDKRIPAHRVVIAEQVHSAQVHLCSEADSGAGFGSHPQIAGADGLVTAVPGQYLLIRTADCLPVLLADSQNRAVGAVHSGREGTRKNIVGRAVRLLQDKFAIAAQDLLAYIGAGVCRQHYEVDEQTWEEYNRALREQGLFPDLSLYRHPDIRLGVFQQLIAAGIPFRNIEQVCICTYEAYNYHSYRRDGTRNRQINLIGMEYE